MFSDIFFLAVSHTVYAYSGLDHQLLIFPYFYGLDSSV
uniref:Uncharacterized protein n=1 Tax=Rhizophora mucronata TaxID=61149 RepID=A0A2P2M2M0_RHIMU